MKSRYYLARPLDCWKRVAPSVPVLDLSHLIKRWLDCVRHRSKHQWIKKCWTATKVEFAEEGNRLRLGRNGFAQSTLVIDWSPKIYTYLRRQGASCLCANQPAVLEGKEANPLGTEPTEEFRRRVYDLECKCRRKLTQAISNWKARLRLRNLH